MIAAVTVSIVKSLSKEALNAMGSEVRGSKFCSTRSMIRRKEEEKVKTKITTAMLCSSFERLRELKPPAAWGAGKWDSTGHAKD